MHVIHPEQNFNFTEEILNQNLENDPLKIESHIKVEIKEEANF